MTDSPGPAGKLAAHDALRDRLRADHPGKRIIRTPWGWAAVTPHGGEIQAPTLEELAVKLERLP